MSIGTRLGSVTLVLSALALPALAQTTPSGTWTDPPVRGSAAPQESPKGDDSAGKPSADVPAPDASATKRAAAPETTPSSDAKDAATKRSVAAASTRRSAGARREHIRRTAARSRAIAEARDGRRQALAGRRSVLREEALASRSRTGTRRSYARRIPAPYRGRYAWREMRPAYDDIDEAGPYYGRAYAPRTAGWGGLLGSGRARRLAEARASGYIVMRSRTYEYPDGTQVRSLRPLGYGDFD